MSAQCEVTARKTTAGKMGFFERYLTAWVFLCIVAGIGLGHWFPVPFQFLGRLEVAQVNLPVAILIISQIRKATGILICATSSWPIL